jgi:hypothetical protein
MRRAAARELLETHVRGFDLPRRAPVFKQQLGAIVAFAIKDLEPALLVLERTGVGLEAALGDERLEQAIARDMPVVQRLGQ